MNQTSVNIYAQVSVWTQEGDLQLLGHFSAPPVMYMIQFISSSASSIELDTAVPFLAMLIRSVVLIYHVILFFISLSATTVNIFSLVCCSYIPSS